MAIEKLGVQVANPDCVIQIEGQSFADLICYQHLHTENLKQTVAALNQASNGGMDEQLAAIQINVQALANTSAEALRDYLRIAREQGLHFETIGTKRGVH